MSERRITAEMLAQKDADCDEIDEFRERFPDGVDLETVQPKEVVGLNVQWVVRSMLPHPAWKTYKEARDTAWDAYWEAMATAWEEARLGALALARKAHEEAMDVAWEAYEEAEARIATELFRQYWQEEEADDE